MPRNGKRVSKSTPPRALAQESKDYSQWWWIGAVVVVLLIGAGAIWFFTGRGATAVDTPTATAEVPPAGATMPADAVATVAPTTAAPTTESTSEETSSMPEQPSARYNMYSEQPEMQIDPTASYEATISTEKGDIIVDLDAGKAPMTVNNFVFLAREGFYDDVIFHRVEPGFVIQGGDPIGNGTGGPGYTVPAEIGLEHVEGAIAMARLSDQANPERASSGSQFYITLAPTPHLDGAYTVFGHVVEGMDVVQSIEIGDVMESVNIVEK